MCFGGQPSAPVNKPAYAPEEAYQHFDSESQVEGEEAKKINRQVEPTAASAPKTVRRDGNIRM